MAKGERKHGEEGQFGDGDVREGCSEKVRYLSRDPKRSPTTQIPGECLQTRRAARAKALRQECVLERRSER